MKLSLCFVGTVTEASSEKFTQNLTTAKWKNWGLGFPLDTMS